MLNIQNGYGKPWLDRNRSRNIVFYGRVSTEHEAQLSALENQMQWYDDQLRYHPNWTLVERYIDEGITGTQAKKRPAFLRMLEDARAGKFDLIVTREVCRFARNTVDTLVTTRELKNIGVEVYFVEDNIWTMDGDGELRLTIMATLAQEESRKVSERVRAGQHVSREKGTLYGNGNILGYDRIGDTYVINPEQAETVRMIYDLYLYEGMGTGKIAQRLTELGRLNASGLNKWSHGVISRILNNQTYMGIMAYGKSFSNNYLEQKRVNNFDKSSYLCVKGDFPPIVTEEEWHRVQAIKESRVKHSFKTDAKVPVHGTKENHDLWGSRMQCSCGCSFRKNRWHKNTNAPNSYGYQCYNILNNGSGKQRREAGADDTGYCDQPMIADWKLELMGQKILEQIFGEQRDLISYTIDLIRQCYRSQKPAETSLVGITARMERIKQKKERLLDMRTDGEITKEEFLAQRQKLDAELQTLTTEYETLSHPSAITLDQPEWGRIQDALEEILDLSQPKPSPDLIRKFVTKIVPNGKTNFRWYMNLDGTNSAVQDMTVEGRKNKAVVTLCQAEDEDAPGSRRVIHLQTVTAFTSPLVMQHRLLSRNEGFERLPKVRNLHCDHGRCERVPLLLLHPPQSV
ncbi:MAG: recombinase family protein [Oscillospiraceae bacterium]|nr:recombinase family protein [Oscillospiraceae bacterium]